MSEIDLLLENLSSSKYLYDCQIMTGSSDIQERLLAESVLFSLCMTVHKFDYNASSYIFIKDEDGNGTRVPDITMYAAPPVSLARQNNEAILAWDQFISPCNRIGLEHFKISGWNKCKKDKTREKLSSNVEAWRRNTLAKAKNIDYIQLSPCLLPSDRDIYSSFENRYAHHMKQLDIYSKKLGTKAAPIWFIIECDDIQFVSNNNISLPIFATPHGLEIVRKYGFPDGVIYYGVDGIWFATKHCLQKMDSFSSAIALPVTGLYKRIRETWYLFQGSYWKKILSL